MKTCVKTFSEKLSLVVLFFLYILEECPERKNTIQSSLQTPTQGHIFYQIDGYRVVKADYVYLIIYIHCNEYRV